MPGRRVPRRKPCQSVTPGCALRNRRLISTCEVLTGDKLGPVEVQKHEHRTFRVRKDGKPLPLPPVLDPVILEERSRWSKPKAKRDVNKFTPFQQKLFANPYANVLASPVRQCRFTGALLPSDLLTSLTPRIHPETSQPWLLPVNLTTSSSKYLGTSLKISARRPLIEQLGQRDTWKAHLDRRLVEKLGGAKLAKMVWREDMPDLILALMQKKLSNKLRWHLKHSGQLVPCASPRSEDIEGIDDVSCIITFFSLKTIADKIQHKAKQTASRTDYLANGVVEALKDLDPDKSKQATSPLLWNGRLVPRFQPRALYPPLEFNTTQWRESTVAVYSLYDLLGEGKFKELLQGTKFEEVGCVALKTEKLNLTIEVLLAQMQAYVAVPGP